MAVSPDGKTIATGGNDNLVKLWNAEDGQPVAEMAGHERHVYNVAFHPDGQALASADLMGVVKHWNVADWKMAREFKAEDLSKYDKTFHADIGGARSIAFNDDGKLLALGGITNVSNAFAGVGNAAVALFDWEQGKKVQLHKPKANVRGVAWGVAFHPDGYLICAAGGGSGGFLYFYKQKSANEFHQFKLPNSARDLSLSSDHTSIAVPHADGKLGLYSLAKAEPAKKKS